MMKGIKAISLLLGAAMALGMLAACDKAAESAPVSAPAASSGAPEETQAGPQVYFLNFKPEQDAAYQKIAAAYTEATGVPVRVRTAAEGSYDDQLAAELSKTDAPTVFQVSGPVSLARWQGYAADLSGSALYAHLTSPGLALAGPGGEVRAIPFVTEGYGIIVNTTIMGAYFATEGAEVASLEEINSFEVLARVVRDMQAKKDALGIEGVFAATSLKHGEDWRWHTHLMNLAMVYEWRDAAVDVSGGQTPPAITFSYADNYKQLFDLFLDNSTVDRAATAQITVEDAMTEFALGKAAMVQNGDWAHSQIDAVEGNVISADNNVAFLPLYFGAEGEESQGLCIGSENYLCVNRLAPEADRQASLDFLAWLYTGEDGVRLVQDELGFLAPFDSFGGDSRPEDTLGQLVQQWDSRGDVTNLPWQFGVFPGQRFKSSLGGYLQQYAQGSLDWDALVEKTVAAWAEGGG